MEPSFTVQHRDRRTQARTGVLRTAHGEIQTPVFMPVGTQGTVKTVSNQELLDAGAEVVLANTYHLFLRPGEKVIGAAGGLHRFMSWKKPILTDSGGFQIFSLSKLTKVKKEGVEFRSHLDGMRHFLTPEDVVPSLRIIRLMLLSAALLESRRYPPRPQCSCPAMPAN